ncbi:MAG TPA: ectoine/hydroxyectoine ABC transporter substrate-binding protein EhuB [bacterium]|nr:ectoine/hydroxyectoine ABC transporter substrate-binding protein EhuB [bacterium]
MVSDKINRRGLLSAAAKMGVGVLTVGSLATFLPYGEAADDSLARARRQGFLRAAFINLKPLSYVDDKTGNFTGSGPAVAGAILKKLGIRNLDPVLIEFDAIIPGLLDRRWDMSAFPFYITPVRCAQVAFTNPMAQYREGALVKAGNPHNLHSYTDLAKDPQVKVGIGTGNAEIDWAKQSGVKQDQIVLFPEEALGIEALKEGRIDAFLNGDLSLAIDIKDYGGAGKLELAKPFTGPIAKGKEIIAYGGWAMRHQDVTLLNAFNTQLAVMRKSGELQSLQGPFGYPPDSQPPIGLTAKDLCPGAAWGSGYQVVK